MNTGNSLPFKSTLRHSEQSNVPVLLKKNQKQKVAKMLNEFIVLVTKYLLNT